MELLSLGAFLGICFIITWIVIASNAPSSDQYKLPEPEWKRSKPFSETLLEQKIGNLEYENARLEDENRYLKSHRCPIACRYANQTCRHCEPKEVVMLAKTPDEQALVDLMKEMGKPYEKIKKELGIT